MKAWGWRVLGVAVALELSAAVSPAVTWPTVVNADTSFLGGGATTQPVYLTHAGDGSGRLFVVEQAGRIRIVTNGVVVATPFLTITNVVFPPTSLSDERGLLGLAFPPGYAAKRYFYVYYFSRTNTETRVSRYFLTANDNIANAASEQVLLRIFQPQANHNGGQIMFGPDGDLYICVGDGGASYDEGSGHAAIGNGQTPNTLLGKILRIDVESPPVTNSYQIPPSNPFVGNTNFLSEIWAYGMRNPYRCTFDRKTGDLFIADVGQAQYEEINVHPAGSLAGENYGWRRYEGTGCTQRVNDPPCATDTNTLTFPVSWYAHALGRCSITGGYVHRGTPEWWPLHGTYLYADYCTGEFFGLKKDGNSWVSTLLLDTSLLITGSGEDEAGNVYFCANNGAVRRIVEAASDFVDTDGDQMPNLYETYYGLSPTNAADANLDADGDGLSNREELTAGTSPTNAASRLIVGVEPGATNSVVLQWPSVTGRRYGIRSSSNLTEGFAPLVTNLLATPPLNQHTTTPSGPVWFYSIDARTN